MDTISIKGSDSIEIREIQYDSRKVKKGDLFLAIRGGMEDGHHYVAEAETKGAAAVVVENDIPDTAATIVRVEDSRAALALLADNFYGSNSRNLRFCGITGTNGKTTTAYLIKNILDAAGFKTGLIGTIQYQLEDQIWNALWTTPQSLDLHRILYEFRQNNATDVVIEVSSHALVQKRVYGLPFTIGIFTNLSRDHLDYHKSMDEYFKAKSLLFEQITPSDGCAILNIDDSYIRKLIPELTIPYITYSVTSEADVCIDFYKNTFSGLKAVVKIEKPSDFINISSSLVGDFNLYNILAAVGTGLALQLDTETIRSGIQNLKKVPGRFEPVDAEQDFHVIVDYAHTPDSIEKALTAARKLTSEKVIALFGCGGDRDKGKRADMGRCASQLADRIIITSDNPRNEDPKKIIADIMSGIKNRNKCTINPNRREAIASAFDMAQPGDVVLLLGKGHEPYQIIGKNRIPFDDAKEAERILKNKI